MRGVDCGEVAHMSNCTVITLLPDCEVCGRKMNGKFLRNWNGKRVCKPCIEELTSDEWYYALP